MRMKVSTATLCFIILATALGSQAEIKDGARGLLKLNTQREPPVFQGASHQPSDCCDRYTSRKIRCANMRDYFETSSGCFQPAVIFLNKKGKRVCADPRDKSVEICVLRLKHQQKQKNQKNTQLV